MNRLLSFLSLALALGLFSGCSDSPDGDAQAPEGTEGNQSVRTRTLEALKAKGLAFDGQVTVNKRNYSGWEKDGCSVSSDLVLQRVVYVDEDVIKIQQEIQALRFDSEENQDGQSCVSVFQKEKQNFIKVLDHKAELEARIAFLEEGCNYFKRRIAEEAVPIQVADCRIKFEEGPRLEDMDSGFVELDMTVKTKAGDLRINERKQFFIEDFHWVEEFDEEMAGYYASSGAGRADFSYQSLLDSARTEDIQAAKELEEVSKTSHTRWILESVTRF